MSQSGYSISLANGQSWHITAADRDSPVLQKMAEIMKLEESESTGSKIIFIPGDTSKKEPDFLDLSPIKELKNLSSDGWQSNHMGCARFWHHRDTDDTLVVIDKADAEASNILCIVYALYPVFKSAIHAGGLPLHASLIERNGLGYLLVAQSGTGKSTCFRRIPSPWHGVSDEQALIVPVCDRYHVHPFPTWSDFLERNLSPSWDVQRHIPLAGIFFLEQSKDDYSIPFRNVETAVYCFRFSMQIYSRYLENFDSGSLATIRQRLFDNACAVARVVPAFKLGVSLHGTFWDEIDKAMKNNDSE